MGRELGGGASMGNPRPEWLELSKEGMRAPEQGVFSSCSKGPQIPESPTSGDCRDLFLCSGVQGRRQGKGRWRG